VEIRYAAFGQKPLNLESLELTMQPAKITERIKNKAFDLLEQHPDGLRYSVLHSKIQAADSGFNSNTINGCIWNLDAVFPEKVYKPSKGLFRLLKYKPPDSEIPEPAPITPISTSKVKEEDFYAPFADWLKNEIEEVPGSNLCARNSIYTLRAVMNNYWMHGSNLKWATDR